MSMTRDLLTDLRSCRAPAPAFAGLGFLWASLAAQVPVLKAQIDASDAVFGTIFLLASAGSIAAMWFAPQVDRLLGRRSVPLALGFTALMFLLPGLATGIVAFTAVMLLMYAGSGTTDVLMNARVSELESETGRPLMNLNHAVFSFAYAASALMTGWAREAGWPPEAIFAAMAVLVLLLCPMTPQTPHVIDAEEAAAPANRVRAPVVWIGGMVVMIAFLSEASVEGWSALHLERTLGGDPAEGAMGPAILGLTMGFGRLFGQLLAARFADWALIALACLLSAAGLVVAAVAQSLGGAYLGFGAMGLGVSVVAPLALAFVGRQVHPSARVAAIGRAALIGFAAFSVGPGLMGFTAQAFGLRASFVIVSGLLLLTAAFLAPQMRRLATSTE